MDKMETILCLLSCLARVVGVRYSSPELMEHKPFLFSRVPPFQVCLT